MAEQPARLETSSGQAARGGLVDDQSPGLHQARQDERTGMGIPSRQLVDLEETRAVDGVGEAAGRHGRLDLLLSRTVAAEDQVPGRIPGGPSSIARERLDQSDQVLLGHEPADAEEVGASGRPMRPAGRRASAGPSAAK